MSSFEEVGLVFLSLYGMEEVLILQLVILCLFIAVNASNLGEIAGKFLP